MRVRLTAAVSRSCVCRTKKRYTNVRCNLNVRPTLDDLMRTKGETTENFKSQQLDRKCVFKTFLFRDFAFQKKHHWYQKPKTLSLRAPRSLSLSHLSCPPQLIHAVTPFNRGQAVKDPITEVRNTFHVFSAERESADYKFYVEKRIGKRRRVHAWSRERRRGGGKGGAGRGGSALSEWKGQSRESASASSVNVIARM